MATRLEKASALTDRQMAALERRMATSYNLALSKAMKRYKTLFRQLEMIDKGKITAPSGADPDEWRRGWVLQLMRQSGIVQGISESLAEAGARSSTDIKQVLRDGYAAQYKAAIGTLEDEAAKVGLNHSFAQLDKRQIDVIMRSAENRPFTKIAYDRTQDAEKIATRLQGEMMQAALLGESQREVIGRIAKVTGYEATRCKRIAQTEHTRIQSEARWQAGADAQAKGVRVYNEWSCAMMPTSRDTHRMLNGQTAMQGETFKTENGELRFPGDPTAPPSETINCYCVLIPHVLLPGEKMQDNGNVSHENEENGFTEKQESVIINTGARLADKSATRPDEGWQKDHATRFYAEVAGRTAYVDANRIVGNYPQFNAGDVERARKHVFLDVHELRDGTHRFYPSYQQALAWQRLCEGKATDTDLTFVKHEIAESKFIDKGYNQDDAHDLAESLYDWWSACIEKGLKDYVADIPED